MSESKFKLTCCTIVDNITSLLAVGILFGTIYSIIFFREDYLFYVTKLGGLGVVMLMWFFSTIIILILSLLRFKLHPENKEGKCFCTFRRPHK